MYVDGLHSAIRHCPKPVIAMVNGFAIGGGHVLHVLCDLSIASENAIFGQTGPRVGSVDAGHGTGYLARAVGEKKAREIWYLCRQYSAQDALDRASQFLPRGTGGVVDHRGRLRPHGRPPVEIDVERLAHFLNFLKSTGRFSTKALRPSIASAVP